MDTAVGAAECERVIQQIRDVLSARVIMGDTGGIEEIHVLANSARGGKQLVRDIESALMAQLGVAVDHRKISVAQVHDDADEARPGRVRLEAVSWVLTGHRAEVRVRLSLGERVAEGTAEGPGSSHGVLRLAAQATLQAVENFLGNTCTLSLDEVAIMPLGRREVAVVGVAMLTRAGEAPLVGSTFVKLDEREAVARATLAAVNRQLAVVPS